MKKLTICILLFFGFTTQAAHRDFGPLFQKNETLQFELRYDIKKFQAEKDNFREIGVPGEISLNSQLFKIEVLSRGKGSFGCQQPQLKLNFKNLAPLGTDFQGFKKSDYLLKDFASKIKRTLKETRRFWQIIFSTVCLS